MGMMLRRYHKPVEESKVTPPEPGTTPTPEGADAAAEANAQKVAAEQQAQADAANAHPNLSAAQAEAGADGGEGPQSVAPIIQEAGAQEFAIVTLADGTVVGDGESLATLEPADPPTVPVTAEGSDTPGDVSVVTAADLSVAEPVDLTPDPETGEVEIPEGLNRGSSTADWREFAKGKLDGSDEMSRDEIAAHFLGSK